MRRQREWIDN